MSEPMTTALAAVRALGEAASPRPWGPITGPSDGRQKAIDDGGDFGILHPSLRPGMIMMEAFRLVQKDTEFPAGANAHYAAQAANHYEPLVEALAASNRELRQRHIVLWGASIEEASEAHRQSCGVCRAATGASALLATIKREAEEAMS